VRHFHFKIRAPGKPELTTQLIVPARPGDSLTFDTDDIAEGLPNCQLLAINETTTPARAIFNFRVWLQSLPTESATLPCGTMTASRPPSRLLASPHRTAIRGTHPPC
jgi:hypothetical protein